MSDLRVERQIEEFEKGVWNKYNLIFYLFTYSYLNNNWEFTIISNKKKTLYLPFNHRSKKVKYSFYYQSKYHRLSK